VARRGPRDLAAPRLGELRDRDRVARRVAAPGRRRAGDRSAVGRRRLHPAPDRARAQRLAGRARRRRVGRRAGRRHPGDRRAPGVERRFGARLRVRAGTGRGCVRGRSRGRPRRLERRPARLGGRTGVTARARNPFACVASPLRRTPRPAPMSVLRNLETKLAGLVEGYFGRVFRTEVRPVELARKLVKEMDEHRTVSLSRTYVPNEFVIWLSPEDREHYEGVEKPVIDELAGYVLEHARRERLSLVSRPV